MSPLITDAFTNQLDVDELLCQLSIEEKASLLAGKDFWHTTPLPLRGIPSIRVSDGPNGIRGTKIFDAVPSSCLPCGTALGATFNTELVAQLGQLQGQEAKAKGAVAVLGPTLNIQRGPLGGRGFESFSEDPLLSGLLAGHYVRGVQQEKVAATLKHFVCNDMEDERMRVNVLVTPRALREIYLLPFMLAISIGDPRAVMTAYNKVNGIHVSESKELLQHVLRDEWKFDGLVISDWFGTYSVTESVQAGVDLEMPGPTRWRGGALAHAVESNKLTVRELDDRVRNVLNLINYSVAAGVPENAPETQLNRPEDQALLRRAAGESIVLLKNEGSVLPFAKSGKTTAVIGPNAKTARFCGGGSASLLPYYAVSPYEGVARKLEDQRLPLPRFAQGTSDDQLLPLLGDRLRTASGQRGFTWRAYNEPATVAGRECVDERVLVDSNCFFMDYENAALAPVWYCQAEGIFTPDESGVYDFGLGVEGTGRLYVDDALVVSNVENQKPGITLFSAGTVQETGSKTLVAGRGYTVRVEWACCRTSKLPPRTPVGGIHGGLRIGAARRVEDPEWAIAEAAALAGEVDQVVLVVGLNGELESEGTDRPHMDMTAHTNALVSAVLAANPNTAVVVQSGTPVGMPWIDQANAVCHAWYGGNETGNAIADVLFGDVNPSGKLPLTIPRRLEDNPTYLNFRSEAGRVLYGEDVYVGYRYYDKVRTSPLFPFGHGLSYSTFTLEDLAVDCHQQHGHQQTSVTLQVSNASSRAGAEVVQVYVAPPPTSAVGRAVKELRGFQKIFLEAGQTRRASIELDTVLATSYWDEGRGQWCSEAGDPADGDGQLQLSLPSPVPSPAPVKGHSLPACDACRLRKRRCSLTAGAEGRTRATGTALATTTTSLPPPPPSSSSPSSGKCLNCERAGSRCTFLLPLRARGPTPGRKAVPAHHQIAAWQVDPHESKTDTAIPTRVHATDILFSRELVLLVLNDYVTYVYPLLPVVHRPSFAADLEGGRDARDGDLLALVVSLCAATVGLLPSRLPTYRAHGLPFETRTAMANHCFRLNQGFRGPAYFDTISHSKWASTYMLGIAIHQTGNANLWRMLEVEAMQLLRLLEVHHLASYAGLDPIEVQLRKKAFCLMFNGYVHQAHNLRNERVTFLDPVLLRTISLDDLMPAPLDDDYLSLAGILPCPHDVASASLTAGFNIHVRVFAAALESPAATFNPPPRHCANDRARDTSKARLAALREQHHRLMSMLDSIPPIYQPQNHHQQHGLQRESTATIQRDAIRANIHVTHLWLQSMLLDQIDAIVTTDQQEEPSVTSPDQHQHQQPIMTTPAEGSWDEREDICQKLLHVIHSISFSGLEVNGSALVYKLRDVAAPLLACPYPAQEDRGRRVAEYVREFSAILTTLDGSEMPHSLSLQSWVDTTSHRRVGRESDGGRGGGVRNSSRSTSSSSSSNNGSGFRSVVSASPPPAMTTTPAAAAAAVGTLLSITPG
ncbi:uncharacterized protein B0I36DRAFT_290164 [Microdochium trichocladiopsis]|uniref:beta-glucosidase n=1 Tax=Microdochium trichocladiopsis TaxID=1682393 RepID=A0A9P9BP52_9PEZI|nr:uncharacterized protein B0I36DRAFT_290164 [Microdochium trichocladiopsis]KAH7028914.1 hypothetical protein B0I36DRAFT_290164 [Microdochium trichocladiopsis]